MQRPYCDKEPNRREDPRCHGILAGVRPTRANDDLNVVAWYRVRDDLRSGLVGTQASAAVVRAGLDIDMRGKTRYERGPSRHAAEIPFRGPVFVHLDEHPTGT